MSEAKVKDQEFFRQERLWVKFPNGDFYEANRTTSGWETGTHSFLNRILNAMWSQEAITVERKVITHVERTEELP
jgi:hypothetical protein